MKAYAKINLTLDVLGKRDDGYHNIKTVMTQLDLFDEVEVMDSEERRIVCNDLKLPTDHRNLCWKAVELVKKRFNVSKEAEVVIEKRIPIGGGLGGGSADAAATIKALNELWDLKISEHDMIEIGKRLGMDVPFCLIGGSCLATERGDQLQRIHLPSYNIVLMNPGFEISTKEAYNLFDSSELRTQNSSDAFLKEKDIKMVGNDLERAVMKRYPVVGRIKEELLGAGAVVAQMSGSGPTVFGLVENDFDERNLTCSIIWGGKTR